MVAPRPGPLAAEAVHRLAPAEVDALLEGLEARVPVHPRLVTISSRPNEDAIVFGDTHGDWRSSTEVAREFLRAPADHFLIGLGDYIDRAPDDSPEGSAVNALYLLGLAAAYPARVLLVQGNHETARRVPVLPHDLPEEIDQLWGPDPARYTRIMALLERGPYAVVSDAGAYLAHAGFPTGGGRNGVGALFDRPDEELIYEVAWRDAAVSAIDRGVAPPFTGEDLERFLDRSGCRYFLRGHDPTLAGRWIYEDRCLTLHTTRIYERYGGVLRARIPLGRRPSSARSVELTHLATEGRSYDGS
jgi:Calcineurin-like phosphoesterase